MRLRSLLLAATVFAVPVAAKAQPIDGLYIGAGAGYNYKQDLNKQGVANSTIRTDGGFVGLASLGYGLGNGLRFEIEGNYRQNNLNKVTGTPFPTNAGGQVEQYGAMVNALYDFDLTSMGAPWISPYIGAGVGYAWTKMNGYRVTGTNFPFDQTSNANEGAFAYQAILGASFPITGVPGLSLTAEYRFMGSVGATFDDRTIAAAYPGAPLHSGFGSFKTENQFNHAGLVGIRYAFNTAPPPPPPVVVAPAPAPARSYLVFFDWDKYNLTDRARQIIKEAAVNSTKTQVTRIDVNGYADTSGTPKYNLGLSIRRANAVKAELVRNGVPASEITTKGFGDTVLLVPTGPGVREPQNRRVEIILH